MRKSWWSRRSPVASSNDDPEYQGVVDWFGERAFGVVVRADEDEYEEEFFWADLTSLPSGWIVAPKYGRGKAAVLAVLSAKERYQAGSMPRQSTENVSARR